MIRVAYECRGCGRLVVIAFQWVVPDVRNIGKNICPDCSGVVEEIQRDEAAAKILNQVFGDDELVV